MNVCPFIIGPIPDSFLNLSKLQGIYLYDNFMEGSTSLLVIIDPYFHCY